MAKPSLCLSPCRPRVCPPIEDVNVFICGAKLLKEVEGLRGSKDDWVDEWKEVLTCERGVLVCLGDCAGTGLGTEGERGEEPLPELPVVDKLCKLFDCGVRRRGGGGGGRLRGRVGVSLL